MICFLVVNSNDFGFVFFWIITLLLVILLGHHLILGILCFLGIWCQFLLGKKGKGDMNIPVTFFWVIVYGLYRFEFLIQKFGYCDML